MHSDHDLENEIRTLLRETHLQPPPTEVSDSFEEQVWNRITNPRPFWPAWLPVAIPVLLLIALLAAYGVWTLKSTPLPVSEMPKIQTTPLVAPKSAIVVTPVQTSAEAAPEVTLPVAEMESSVSDETLDSLIQDLLVLEWLGEDNGLLEDWNQQPGAATLSLTQGL